MNQDLLIRTIAEDTFLSREVVKNVIDEILNTIQLQVAKKDKINLVDFGNFSAQKRTSRMGRNPRTGEEFIIHERMHPVFRAGKRFKELVR